MYNGNNWQLFKIFDSTPSVTSTLKRDVLILDFSSKLNSQAAVTIANL